MIAKGNQSTESVGSRKLYIGVGAVKVLAVNPTKAELEKLYGRELEKDPEYLSSQEIDGKVVPTIRITFIVEADPEKNNGIDVRTNHTIFLRKAYAKSKEGKYKVIDKYGRTTWVTAEEAREHAIPQHSNGPARIDPGYRGCYEGEEELTSFIKNYLVIPNIDRWDGNGWVQKTEVNPADCEVRFDKIDDFFKGDLKELKEALSYRPDNTVKIPFGVRNDTDTNRQLQTTYIQWSCVSRATDYSKFAKEVAERRERGGLSTVEFEASELREYEPKPTDLTPSLEQAAAANIAGEETPW